MPLTLAEKNAITDRVNKFLTNKKFAEFYDRSQLEGSDGIRQRLIKRCLDDEERNDTSTSRHLTTLNEILDARKEALRHQVNVLRQKEEVRAAKENPGKFDVAKMATQLRQYPAFRTAKHPVAAADLDLIKKCDTPLIFPYVPGELEFRALRRAEKSVDGEIFANSSRLDSLLTRGRDLSKKEIDDLRNESKLERVYDFVNPAYRAHQAAKTLLGGIYGKEKSSETETYAKFSKKRQQLLEHISSKLKSQPVGYARTLAALLDELKNSGDLLDTATFNRMSNEIAAAIKTEDAAHNKKVDDFNKSMQTTNAGMLKALDKYQGNENEKFKFRILQLFLMISPLAGFSVIGAAFNYMGPIAQILEPIFNNGDFIHGIASSVRIVGLDKIGVDKVIETILRHIPGVGEFGSVVDTLTSGPVGGGLTSLAMKGVGSSLVPLAIGAYAASRFAEGLAESSQNKAEIKKKYRGALKDTVQSFENNYEKVLTAEAATLGKKHVEALKASYYDTLLTDAVFGRLAGLTPEDGFLDSIQSTSFKNCTVAQMQANIAAGKPAPDRKALLAAVQSFDEETRNKLLNKFIPFSDRFLQLAATELNPLQADVYANLSSKTKQYFAEESSFEAARKLDRPCETWKLSDTERKSAAASHEKDALNSLINKMTQPIKPGKEIAIQSTAKLSSGPFKTL